MKRNLDSTGMVHIGMMNDKSINGYRISISMKSAVDPQRLQKAADRVVARYPMICCRMTKDSHWCYTEPVEKITVLKDSGKILGSINKDNVFDQAMNIIYEDNRIILEVFHALTDGHGIFTFLNALLKEYIALEDKEYDMPYLGIAPDGEYEDGFAKHGTAAVAEGLTTKVDNPYYFDTIDHSLPLKFTTFRLNRQDFKQKSKTFRCTLNELLLVMIYKAIFSMKGTDNKDVVLAVPINLRNKFESASLRNFIHIAKIGVRKNSISSATDEMIMSIRNQLHRQNNKEYLHKAITQVARLRYGTIMRLSPLWLKTLIIKAGVICRFDKSCMTVSNLGDLSYMLPDAIHRIQHVDTMLSPRPKSRYNCCVATVGDIINVTFTHATADDSFIKGIHSWLGENNISYTTHMHN